MLRTYLKRTALALLAVLAVFVAMNWGYLWKVAEFYANPPGSQGDLPPLLPADGQKAVPDRLRIAALGIEAPLVYTDARDEGGFQLALRGGVVHYPDTALPGQPGNAYFFGHSSDYPLAPGDYKTVFALLPQIKDGDMVEVTDREGNLFTYRVARRFVTRPDDLSVLGQDLERKTLTLQTSYPVGTALQRYIVVAELVVN